MKMNHKTVRRIYFIMFIFIGLVVALFFCSLNVKAEASVIDSWYLMPDGVLTIGGQGEMDDFEYDSHWRVYKEEITKVVIQEGVTSIGANAFKDCSNLVEVSLPSTLEKIGAFAFYNCNSIGVISIPQSVNSIGLRALEGAYTVEYEGSYCDFERISNNNIAHLEAASSGHHYEYKITKKGGVIDTGTVHAICTLCGVEYDINYNEDGGECCVTKVLNVTASTGYYIELPEEIDGNIIVSVTDVVNDNWGTVYVEFPDSIARMSSDIFNCCWSLVGVKLPSALEEVPYSMFINSSIRRIEIPQGVKKIESYAFEECINLEQVTICDGLKSISEKAFYKCDKLKSIYIPSSVEYIGETGVGMYYNNISMTYKAIPDFIIYGRKGSYAEQYALSNGITFVDVENGSKCVVTYVLEGGTNNSDNVIFFDPEGEAFILKEPRREGYLFCGWYTDSSYTKRITELNSSISGNVTIYAKWEMIYDEYGYKVTLDSNIHLQYYLKLPFSIMTDPTTYVKFTFGEEEEKVYVSSVAYEYAIYICDMPIKCVIDTVSAELYYQGINYKLSDFSVKNYLEIIIKESKDDPEYAFASPLAYAILDYAAYAQIYFDYKTNTLANDTYTTYMIGSGLDSQIKDEKNKLETCNTMDVSFIGGSLICETDTDLRLYFTINSMYDTNNMYDTYDCYVIGGSNPRFDIDIDGGIMCVTICDIPAAELDNDFIFVMDDGTEKVWVKYSPMTYMKQALDTESDKLKNLCRALYVFSIRADAYYNRYAMPI